LVGNPFLYLNSIRKTLVQRYKKIAFVITLICNIAVYWRSRSSIDDALDVFPIHGTGDIFLESLVVAEKYFCN
jgi:hypothetical protein